MRVKPTPPALSLKRSGGLRRWSWDINGNVIRSEFTNDSELYHGNRVPFVPRYGAGSSVNGVIDTRYGALMPLTGG